MEGLRYEEKIGRTFPDELIKKCQKLILERSGKKITKDTAEIYLDKFARLFKVIIKIMDQEEEKKKKAKSKKKAGN